MTASASVDFNPASSALTAEQAELTRGWIVFGLAAGIAGDVAYFLAVAPLPLPPVLVMLFGFALGPLLVLAFVSFHYFFGLHKKTVALQASVLFGIIAGTIVNMMLVVQFALRLTIPFEARAGLGLAWDGLNMVQLGLDVSWDIFLSLATMFLGWAMLSHPRFGRVWGGLTIAIGAGLLVLNLLTFPVPPGEAGSIDLGPVTGFWYLVIALRVLVSLRWVDERLSAAKTTNTTVARG